MNAEKIPVTILTGFLGAGKTTFLNKLLTSKEEQSIAIVVNEFGEVGVDHEIVLEAEEQIFQMNNGCVCCSLRSDIADVLYAILEAKKDHDFKLDHIIFETTGLADPGPIAQTFFNVPFLKENFEIDSVLTIVDMENILSQLRTREEPIKQIAFADKIIFSKSENVPDLVKRNVISTVEKINPFVEKIMSSTNEFTIDEFTGHQLFHFTEKNIEEESETTDHHHDDHNHSDDHHHHHEHDDVISFAIQEQRVLSQSNTERWLQALIFTYGQDLYRYKGILNVEGIDEQIIFQGVNMSCQFYKGKDWGNKIRESTLVFIGKNIDEHDIVESFDMCLA